MGSYWMERPTLLQVFTALCSFFVGYSLSPLWVVLSLACVLFILFAVLNSVRHAFADGSEDKSALTWLLLWAWVPLVGTYLISLVKPIFQIRTVMTAAPAWYLLLAWGLVRARRAGLHAVLFAPTVVVAAVSAWNFYSDPAYAKPNWRAVAQYVRAGAEVGDVVVHTSDGSFLPFLCYDHDVPQALLPEDPETAASNAPSQHIVSAVGSPPREMEDAVAGHERAWLVVGLDHAAEHQWAQKARFDARYRLLVARNVGGIYVYLYRVQ